MAYENRKEVIEKAKSLLGKSLREVFSTKELHFISKEYLKNDLKRKGRLGEIIEKEYFKINPGSSSSPDFKELNLELKVTPVKVTKKGLSSKERLVLSMIDYMEIINESYIQSKFLKKNKNLILIFYLYEKNLSILDYKFIFIYLFDFTKSLDKNDLKTIENDWNTIKNMVSSGKAHLISEKQTLILAACTKSSTSKVKRTQPLNFIKAKPRAFSLKNSFMTKLVREKSLKNNDINFIASIKTKSILNKSLDQ
jgi:DNA mismatch repair protein MutH